jgi:hypothetical protein
MSAFVTCDVASVAPLAVSRICTIAQFNAGVSGRGARSDGSRGMTKNARRRWNPTRALHLDEIDWGDGPISRTATASNGPTGATTHASKAFIASPSSSLLDPARSIQSIRPEFTHDGKRLNHNLHIDWGHVLILVSDYQVEEMLKGTARRSTCDFRSLHVFPSRCPPRDPQPASCQALCTVRAPQA